MQQRWIKLGIGVLASLLLIIGLRAVAAPAFENAPDSVRITVTQVHLPGAQHTVIFDQQFSSQASAIYQHVTSDTQYDNDHFASCPGISNTLDYYNYQLQFFHLGVKVATATSEARGCAAYSVMYLDGHASYDSWVANDHTSFWEYLRQTANVPLPLHLDINIHN